MQRRNGSHDGSFTKTAAILEPSVKKKSYVLQQKLCQKCAFPLYITSIDMLPVQQLAAPKWSALLLHKNKV